MTIRENTLSAVRVEFYAGHRGEETPRRFFLASRKIEVEEVTDRWLAPEHRYFKLRGDDGGLYILRQDLLSGRWEVTFYLRDAPGGTGTY